MMGPDEANSPAVEEMRETEDGVNRALLISAEEIKRFNQGVLKGKPREPVYRRAVSGRSSAATASGRGQRADGQADHRAGAFGGG